MIAAVILIAIDVVTLAGWQATPAQHSADVAQQTQHAVKSSYTKWLNEDVVYIIGDQERSAFDKLTTDEERNKFIEQFWLRRGTPGTSADKVKKEHYRRIAYASDRFRTETGRLGWKTDRGHVYIVYGPPDEIESRPSGTQNSYSMEAWKYRHVEGIGDQLYVTFIDRARTGDFRLAPGNGRFQY